MKGFMLLSIFLGIVCCSVADELCITRANGNLRCVDRKGFRFASHTGRKRQWEETPTKDNPLNYKETEVMDTIKNLLAKMSAQRKANYVNKIELIERIVQDLNMNSYEWEDFFDESYIH